MTPESVPLSRLDPGSPGNHAGAAARPPRIVVYRRPLAARADSEEELGEIIFQVVVEELARLLGIDPEQIDPGYDAGRLTAAARAPGPRRGWR